MTRPPRHVLLNPGPATTSQSVKDALVVTDVCPREESFTRIAADVRRRIARLAGSEDHAVVLLPGSGTAGLEAALGRLVPPEGRLVVLDNGDYGSRLAAIGSVLGLPMERINVGWGRAIAEDEVRARVDAWGNVTHLALVHHETSTGMLNDLDPWIRFCGERDITLMVDAMSSFGALPIEVGPRGVDVVVASSNKCIQGMAGLAMVVLHEALLDRARRHLARSHYLDLVAEHDHVRRTGQSRFTCPPQLVYALRAALIELEAETVAGRRQRYSECYERLRAGIVELGFEPLLERSQEAGILLAIRVPAEAWFDFDSLHDALFDQGFTIYPGKAGETPTFRLSVLGDLSVEDIDAFLRVFGELVAEARG